ncbi:MAG: nitroreductase family deazaflavin-dependent oxidoreductase [Chloroflexi bacterium]|nr:nitroreductase family deazaflavin-dependent oxidoreductase [Chloroflexota bacterium]
MSSPAMSGRPKPRGLMRIGLRIPIFLYRIKLGWLLGQRALLLTHIGRKSGQARQAVIEVVDHDTADDTYYIASGWGEKSDWYRNIQKNAQVTVQVGNRRWPALAVRLPADAAANHFAVYAQKHPRAFRELAKIMVGEDFSDLNAACRRMATSVPLIALRRSKR